MTAKSIHARCFTPERDADGTLTGAICQKSYGHVRSADIRRRSHFDPNRNALWLCEKDAEKLDEIIGNADEDLLAQINKIIDIPARLEELLREAETGS